MAFAVAINVTDWVITSSPGSTLDNNSAICKAAVPFTVATAYFEPVYSAHNFSNLPTYSPTEETKFDFKQSKINDTSFQTNLGSCSGTILFSYSTNRDRTK